MMDRIKKYSKNFLIMTILTVSQISLSQNNLLLQDCEPAVLYEYFTEISKIPRGSGNEMGIANFIINEAKMLGLQAVKDNVGNVIVRKHASSKLYDEAPIVVIQSHMDMVCEKNKDVNHDFSKDPIKFVRKGNLLFADGTTLGADNGIGVAASLALMKANNLNHGDLEFVFTVMEEAGFDGAFNIKPESFLGRILLNIDTEEQDSIYVGCAGSSYVVADLEIKREKLDDNYKFFSIIIDGLRGGHSGVDIDKQDRPSSLTLVKRLFKSLNEINYRLVSINGGNKRNAIARYAEIEFAVPNDQENIFNEKFDEIKNSLINEFSQEKNIKLTKQDLMTSKEVIALEDQGKIISLVDKIQHGVIKMCNEIKDLVETSTNFARISTSDDKVSIETMQRSLIRSEMDKIAQSVESVCKSCGMQTKIQFGSPEWQPNLNTDVLKIAKRTYKKLFNKKPEVKAIHAGLECGAFAQQIPGLDTISFGPTIIDAHSPNEHVDLNSIKPFWAFLTQLIENIAKNYI